MRGRVRQIMAGAALATMVAGSPIRAQVGTSSAAQPSATEATITINTEAAGAPISKDVYGQFSEHLGQGVYGGLWVGQDSKIPNTRGFRKDVVAALRALEVPLLRWPGGCFADKYDWHDGIGDPARRPRRVNTAWGDIPETNAVGTHEFMDLLGQIGADAYVAGNMGSSTPMEMARWIEYMTSSSPSTLADQRRANGQAKPFRVSYFGIGNETWGCGGNMTPEQAAAATRQYSTFLSFPTGTRTVRVAAGPNVDDYRMTEAMMRDAGARFFDALSLHHYSFGDRWEHKGQAVGFPEKEWATALKNASRMEELVNRHAAIMDRYDPDKRVMLAVDEWGSWLDTPPGTDPNLYKWQNTLRDALVASLTLNIFHRHSDRVRMATIAQMVNVDQAMVMTDGPRMFRTPTYWVFDMYKPFKTARPLAAQLHSPDYRYANVSLPAVDASAARDANADIWLALSNLDPHRAHRVQLTLSGPAPTGARGRILTGPAMDTHNDYDAPNRLVPVAFMAGVQDGKLVVDLPAKSIAVVRLDR